MTATCYITFGQKYRYEVHPVNGLAHPDGWFEYVADTYGDALRAAQQHLMGDDGFGTRVPLYAFDYHDRALQCGYYSRGCLARFDVGADGSIHEADS